ncbi:DNA-binding transcription factor RAP1 KNAG_0F00950 [Huiozyma naganishii CBS 8797]|uniref:DNA-binding protein RAP1 n=1 Tax=Huiozyma naganishii (strain ATCC MYA-139 / BCRC 22969 / CBS 8797 / KCTC 17520 / NBRC 10181 / NCYC 3082 / Yp74L-3) TaxID=1071383 RepID=J7S744_HUIN7|nr:hypothetical protein KNAG_0F00950 [Kazachstania naganishii CBS 8797]CCK70764.1 hypothetical protein KNAG_0F00950 [Kazachstania naganishii CBS 8797]
MSQQVEDFDTAPEQFVDALDNEAASDPVGSSPPTGTVPRSGANNARNHAKGTAAAAEDKTKNKFWTGMRFFINREDTAHDNVNDADRLAALVTTYGGELIDEVPDSTDQDGKALVISPYNYTNRITVTPTYLKACAKSNTLLSYNRYIVPFDEYGSAIDTQLRDSAAAEEKEQGPGSRGTPKEDSDGGLFPNFNDTDNEDDNSDESDRARQLKLLQEHASEYIPGAQSAEATAGGRANSGVAAEEGKKGGAKSENKTRSVPRRANMANPQAHAHNKASFTEDEDEFILDVVRKNPTRRTTHTLYDEISHYVPNHTGNSIRHRFRVYLSKRLDFVYEVDKYGKLLRDERGNLIKTKVLPPAIKKKFVAEEDYDLAIAVKQQFYRDLYQIDPISGASLISSKDTPTAIAKRSMTMDPNYVPGQEPTFETYRVNGRRGPIAREFFKNFSKEHPSHTENAWRDRFRKFLLQYGVDTYISYYEEQKAQNSEPEPMKNMTNRPKRPGVPTPGNYNSSVKKARNYGAVSYQQLDQSGADEGNAATAADATTPGTENATKQVNAVPESLFLDEETLKYVTNLQHDLSKLDSNMPFEYPPDIAESIRMDFSNEEEAYDTIDPDLIPFPPKIATADLFLPKFFELGSVREFMQKVDDIISRDYEPTQAEKLVQSLCDEAGIRKTFSTSVLTYLSGDLMLIPRYFLTMFKNNSNPPQDVPGIWTREDDLGLRSGNEETLKELIRKHGTGRIEMRRKFIEKDLI